MPCEPILTINKRAGADTRSAGTMDALRYTIIHLLKPASNKQLHQDTCTLLIDMLRSCFIRLSRYLRHQDLINK